MPSLQKVASTVIHSIVFAPIWYRGCGFTPLSLVQGEGQIVTFLKHWQTDMDAGNLHRIALSWTQLHLGNSFCCLQDTKTRLPHMPRRWLKSLCSFLASIGGSLELYTFYLPPTQQHQDVYMMDMVLHLGSFSNSEICQINHCRMFLQAITQSDLCIADGVTLDPAIQQAALLPGFKLIRPDPMRHHGNSANKHAPNGA
jgi:hypothetical protein